MRLLFLFLYFVLLSNASVLLTEQEKTYLANKKVIKMCNNHDWIPIEFISKENATSKPDGISIDMMKTAIKKLNAKSNLNIKLEHIPTKSWKESQEFLKQRKCDILPSAIKTDKRKKYANFTKPYLDFVLVIITRKDAPFNLLLDDIKDKIIARKEGSGLIRKLKKLYPDIKILETKTYKDSFEVVSKGKAYATIATLPVAAYHISRFGYTNLKIAGYTTFNYKLSVAIRNDDTLLLNIIQKAINNISQEEQNKIFSKWIKVEVKKNSALRYTLYIAGIIILIVLIIIYMQNKKQQKFKQKMKDITQILEATIEGIALFDQNSVCIFANAPIKKILNSEKESLIGKSILEFVDDEHKDKVQQNLKKEYVSPYELKMKRVDKTPFFAMVSAKNIYYEGEKVRLVSVIDVTKMKQIQQKLQDLNKNLQKKVNEQVEEIVRKDTVLSQQSKLATIGEMIGTVAHQWKQPLNTLGIIMQDIEDAYEYGELDRKYLEDSVKSGLEQIDFMSETIDDFRNFFRVAKDIEEFHVKDAINEVLHMFMAQFEKYLIHIDLKGDDFVLKGYKNEFKHVILNITNNAKDALLENNDVKNRKIEIVLENNSIFIRDNAGGIPEDVIDKIFDNYFTTKEEGKGTGIGLYISKIIVEDKLGGKLMVRNTKDGAEFIFDFS